MRAMSGRRGLPKETAHKGMFAVIPNLSAQFRDMFDVRDTDAAQLTNVRVSEVVTIDRSKTAMIKRQNRILISVGGLDQVVGHIEFSSDVLLEVIVRALNITT